MPGRWQSWQRLRTLATVAKVRSSCGECQGAAIGEAGEGRAWRGVSAADGCECVAKGAQVMAGFLTGLVRIKMRPAEQAYAITRASKPASSPNMPPNATQSG